jgi:hypothetical protein
MRWKYTKEHGNSIAKRPIGPPPIRSRHLRPKDEFETNKYTFSQYTAKLPEPEAELKNWKRYHRSLWEAGQSHTHSITEFVG